MDYEKKYKEALEVAKRKLCFDKAGMVDSFTPNDIYEMFPELKGSEDEKIRKELIGFLRNIPNSNYTCEEMALWLEKQGEIDKASYEIAEKEKREFVGDGFIKCHANFQDFKEGSTYWLEYIGNDNYNVRSDNLLGKNYHITPCQLYTIFKKQTWLEMQGEQKQEEKPRYNIGDVICDKSCTTLNKEAQPNMEIVDIKNGMYICDKGSFPVSQQDEYVLVGKKIDTKLNDDSVSNELREASFAHAEKELKNHTFPDNEEFELIYTFEEGAKWQATQKSSWSKDDDDNLGMIESRLIDLLSYTRKDNSLTKHRKNTIEEEVVGYVNWLTSLKARFIWKPSDEQMEAFEHFVKSIGESGYASSCDGNTKLIYSLLKQLKKLK